MRLGAIACCAALAPILTWATTKADGSAGPIEIVNSASAVAQPAAATQQAKRLMIDATKPIFPMQITPTCHVLDNFGDARSGGRRHEGTDILASLDQEVYAVVDGTLSHQVINGAANSSLSGNSWHLDAAGTSKTYYAYMHLSHFAAGLSNGSFVSQGQLIGYVGDTGDPGPGNYHLHFEVHPQGGVAVNALTVLTVPAGCTVW
jgi:murein DD-endopeptidase MepM/ murein hydrolase activator NlpD